MNFYLSYKKINFQMEWREGDEKELDNRIIAEL